MLKHFEDAPAEALDILRTIHRCSTVEIKGFASDGISIFGNGGIFQTENKMLYFKALHHTV